MKEFDYSAAWREMIVPEWGRLMAQDAVRVAVETAIPLVQDLNQANDLDIHAPSEAVEALSALDSITLARLAYVTHALTHWCPEDAGALRPTFTGWKVSNVIDQILTARLGLVRDRQSKHDPCGVYFFNGVFEGRLRAALSTRNSWEWSEVCWATRLPELPTMPNHAAFSKPWEFENARSETLKAWADGIAAVEFAGMDSDAYMVEKEKAKA